MRQSKVHVLWSKSTVLRKTGYYVKTSKNVKGLCLIGYSGNNIKFSLAHKKKFGSLR